MNKDDFKNTPVDTTDYLANERTFLSWIRTGIAVMAFGFVVVRFDLFIKQLHVIMQNSQQPIELPDKKGFTDIFGIVLVCLGTILPLLAYLRYRKTAKEIYEKIYKPSLTLSFLTAISIILIGVLLVFSLVTK